MAGGLPAAHPIRAKARCTARRGAEPEASDPVDPAATAAVAGDQPAQPPVGAAASKARMPAAYRGRVCCGGVAAARWETERDPVASQLTNVFQPVAWVNAAAVVA